MSRVPFIGLTGGIGAGKSTALAALERLGAATVSADAVVHRLYERDDVIDAVVGRWGTEMAPGGVVDRSAIASRVFADAPEREWLETLLWPLVAEQVAAFRAAASARLPPPRAVVVETPLLFEAGMEAVYDATIAVIADDDIRAERLGRRGQTAIAERSARQLTQEHKAARATFTVDNAGTPEQLEQRLSDVLATLERT
ncbi:MAG TPA: dephospho-CoA kinase [Solirubrobacteraceae bacterium]|nr:dephospho-CoA kinase [Solirubrobacteraceae bacterium]